VPFTQIPNDLIVDTDLTPHTFRVYAYLMRRANSEGRAWPTVSTIAEDLGMSKTTVSKATSELEESGWLTVVVEQLSEHRQRNLYSVHGTKTVPADDTVSTVPADEPVQEMVQTVPADGTEPYQEMVRKNKQQEQTSNTHIPRKRNEPNDTIWDWLVDADRFGMPAATPTQKKRVGRLVRELAPLIPDDVSREGVWSMLDGRVQVWPMHFPGATLTPEALVKHFTQLTRPPLRRSDHDMRREATRSALNRADTGRNPSGWASTLQDGKDTV